jgi:hypothetical protein
MIKMKSLLTEIDLSSLTPYVTQFTWNDAWGDASNVNSKVMMQGVPVKFTFNTEGYTGTHYNFGFWTNSNSGVFTTSTSGTSAKGQLSYMRLMLTCLEAIRDFANTHDVSQLDISGADQSSIKGAQKTRIYAELFKANSSMFPDFNISQPNSEKLVLVRKDIADASGIRDTP